MSQNVMELLGLMPGYFGQHLLVSFAALWVGLAISLPLGVMCSRWRSVSVPVMGFASAVQTVPSLALLALMVPLLGMIGFVPALIALVLYSMLPVLRNTITGLSTVDRALLEAADGVGMTRWQRLWKVELPMASPSIIAGIRTSAVWVVGIATLATLVGQTTLGNYIFTGLQTQNTAAVIVGCVAAAALALILDAIIRLIEWGSIKGSHRIIGAGVVLLMGLFMLGVFPLIGPGKAWDSRPTLIIGAKTFTEQHVLAEVLAEKVREAGIRPITKAGMGSQLLFDALASGEVDAYVDYTGTIWTNVMKRTDQPGRRQMMVDMKRWLWHHQRINVVGRLGFENTYALAMRRDTAQRLGIVSISDLRSHASQLTVGGDVEFFGRPEWKQLQDRYDLVFDGIKAMDASIMYAACERGAVDVIAAFSSDGRLAAFDLLVLRDDLGVFPPYDAIVLLSENASARSEVVQAMSELVNSIDDDLMRKTNKLVDVDGQSPSEAARQLIGHLESDEQVVPEVTPVVESEEL